MTATGHPDLGLVALALMDLPGRDRLTVVIAVLALVALIACVWSWR